MNRSRIATQTAMELRLTLRNGESMLLVLGIPVLLLLFFGSVDVLPTESATDEPVDFLLPGILALAVMSTAFVNLAIATGFDRQYGVLKRLGSTPLTRGELLGAKVLTLSIVEMIQVTALFGAAVAIGWPGDAAGAGSIVLGVLGGAVLGTAAFAGLGFLLAGVLPGLVVLAAANAIYLVLLLGSGMIIPLEEFADGVADILGLLPSTALAQIMHGSIRSDTSVGTAPWIVLGAWSVAAPLAATRWFRWSVD